MPQWSSCVRWLIVLAMAAIGAGCASRQQMSGPEMVSEFSGKRIAWTCGKSTGTTERLTGGVAVVLWDNGVEDRGTWRVDGDLWCDKIELAFDDKEFCFKIYKKPDGGYRQESVRPHTALKCDYKIVQE